MTLSLDGEAWCALYGENLQIGMAGFGATKIEALTALFRQLGFHGPVRWQVMRQPEVAYGAHGEWLTLARAINEYEWRQDGGAARTNYHADFKRFGRVVRLHVGRADVGTRFTFRGYVDLRESLGREGAVRCLTNWEQVFKLPEFLRLVDEDGTQVPLEDFWRMVWQTAGLRDTVEHARGRFPREWHDGGGWPFRGEDFS